MMVLMCQCMKLSSFLFSRCEGKAFLDETTHHVESILLLTVEYGSSWIATTSVSQNGNSKATTVGR